MIKKIILLIFITTHAFAQLQQTDRFELEVKRYENTFSIIPADSSGLFLIQETDDYDKRNKKWRLLFLNSDLEKLRDEELLIDDKYKWIGYEYNAPDLYLLFRQGDMSRADLHVIKTGSRDKNVERYDITNEIDFNITHFSVCNNSALMGGYVDERPTLLLYNFEEGKVKAVPGFYLEDSQLIDITVNVNNTFNVLISNEKNQGRKFLDLKVYNDQGNVLAEDIFYIPEGKDILNGLTSRLENESLIVTGIFGSKKSKLSEGIYWAKADLSKEQEITLIPFSEFSSLYDHVSSERRRQRLMDKADKKKETDPFFEREHIYLHKLLEENDRYYLLMELFDPIKYRSTPVVTPYGVSQRFAYPYSRFYSRLPYAYDVEDYVNIKYKQAMVAAMDDAGNLIWDEALIFDEKETGSLEQIADFTIKEDTLSVIYKKEEELLWKNINVRDTAYTENQEQVRMLDPTDDLKNEIDEDSGIKYWYDGAFYIYGYQTLVRREEGSNERYHVFYINKMQLVEQ